MSAKEAPQESTCLEEEVAALRKQVEILMSENEAQRSKIGRLEAIAGGANAAPAGPEGKESKTNCENGAVVKQQTKEQAKERSAAAKAAVPSTAPLQRRGC